MNPNERIRSLIHFNQGIPLDQFLSICISYYYNTRDPFGKKGDFITAPEITQMFGEIIGIWCANAWIKLGMPKFNLVEIGGGRGTLMDDLLRGTKHIREFAENIRNIYMIETSESLKSIQRQKLSLHNYNFIWLDDIENLEPNPNIIINNEFFDALPIKQFIKSKHGFKEVFITLKENKFVFAPLGVEIQSDIECKADDIIEVSPVRESYANKIATIIKDYGGAGLIIDYGYINSPFISTLQAMKDNTYHNIFHNIGEADLTSHVDFDSLIKIFENEKLQYLFSTQGEFLKKCGIEFRAEQLIKNGADKKKIQSELYRLVDKEQMGELFKVLEIYY
ncbi:SAM-dependent methyltransferase [Holosporaceae bacterium 'Namur']|nr:SAM-dependent methyltransferase [Holosporaceae bacterium 'Namur']